MCGIMSGSLIQLHWSTYLFLCQHHAVGCGLAVNCLYYVEVVPSLLNVLILQVHPILSSAFYVQKGECMIFFFNSDVFGL